MTMRAGRFILTLLAGIVLRSPGQATFGPITQISLGLEGEQPNDDSATPVVSTRADTVAFASIADNLVEDDFNGSADIFIVDRTSGLTTRIVGPEGEFEFDSESPRISGDGQLIAFVNDGRLKVFSRAFATVQDIEALFIQPYAFSENGRFLAMAADDDQELAADDFNGASDIYVYDRLAATFDRVSRPNSGGEANGPSVAPAITADGRLVAFVSSADNLVAGGAGEDSVYVFDRIGRSTERVSGFGAGEIRLFDATMSPAMSADGRLIAYLAETADGVGLFRRDRIAGTTARLAIVGPSTPPDVSSNSPLTVSNDGLRYGFGLFGLVSEDVYLFDTPTASTALVSVAAGGGSADGDSIAGRVSGNGRAVVFVSNASNLGPEGPDGFVQNVYLASPSAPTCQPGDVNGDGRVDAADIPALVELIFGGAAE